MTASPGLDAWAARQESRCACGFHVATQGCHCPTADDRDWLIFVNAARKVEKAGRVHQCDMRPLLRGALDPKSIGRQYARAKREGLLIEREPERSNDEVGRNAGRWEPTYELAAA